MEALASRYALHHGDSLRVLPTLPAASVDAVITDPPYSSGGTTAASRTAPTGSKYVQSGTRHLFPDFDGDTRDQRSWIRWCSLWLSECYRIARPGAYLLTFNDWRQLPATSDALQCAGWTWRGVVTWDKTEGARAPHTGYFRHQCEFIAWATKGPVPRGDGRGPFPGCFRFPVRKSDKHHQVGKPTDLMRRLVKAVPPGGVILDPFSGSGTTGEAALTEGYGFVGVESNPGYFEVASRRLADVAAALASN